MITEFKTGDKVTFDSYGTKLPAVVKSSQQGLNGNGLYMDGTPDKRVFYKLSGKNVLTCCSGMCIVESKHYKESN
jgi:hypothetical protein